MEIKTCEMYVLRRVGELEDKVEDLIVRNIELEDEKNRAKEECAELKAKLDRLVSRINDEGTHFNMHIWNHMDKDFDFVKELVKEREPNSEE